MVASHRAFNATHLSLDEWMQNPPERTEWVDGNLVEKQSMTLRHSRVQLRLGHYWITYVRSSGQGGEVYTEAPCRTHKQGRAPDVSYLTPTLLAQYGNAKVLPQSFPLSAEIVSPSDLAEEVIAKAQEYLESGGEEVWLVYPEVGWIVGVTQASKQIFVSGEIARTQMVLPGFSVAVDEVLA